MAFKVAVGSSDGKVINQHFGRSRNFLIFNIHENGEYSFLESRDSSPSCSLGEHYEEALYEAAKTLSDCKVVLISQIGPGAEQVLNSYGIKAFSITAYIDDALKRVFEFGNKAFIKNKF